MRISSFDVPVEGMKLTYRVVSQLEEDMLPRNAAINLLHLLEMLEGSRVEAYLARSEMNPSLHLQLRCGEAQSSQFDLFFLSDILRLVPFIAACAGAAEPELSDAQKLVQRVDRLEEIVSELSRQLAQNTAVHDMESCQKSE